MNDTRVPYCNTKLGNLYVANVIHEGRRREKELSILWTNNFIYF